VPEEADHGARLVVLGVEGLDVRLLGELVERGKVPNLARLHRTALETTVPSDPSSAWSSFATGTPPAAHGIPGDVMRLPSSYRLSGPCLAPELARLGEPFWNAVARAGRRVRVLRAPLSCPPSAADAAEVLGGAGTPDLGGGPGDVLVVRSSQGAAGARPPGGGIRIPVTTGPGGGWEARIEGPRQGGVETVAQLSLAWSGASGSKDRVLIVDGGREAVQATPGKWSDWIELSFEGGGKRIAGITRILVLAGGPGLDAVLEPVSADPYAPVVPLSSPRYYAGFLADRYGRFRTTGSLVDERAFAAGRIGPAAFLNQTYSSWEQSERMTLGELGRGGWDLLLSVLPQAGGAVRVLARAGDERLPAHDSALDAGYGENLEKLYVRLDRLVGEIMKGLSASDRLIVVGVRGVRPVRRELNLTSWLVREGYTVLQRKARSSARDGYADVDWERTRAYAAGAGAIFLNLSGREPMGVVEPGAEADDLLADLREKLLALRDGSSPVVRDVVPGAEVFAGPALERAPDLLVVLHAGYAVGSGCRLGAVPATVLQDSTRPWIPAADGGDPVDAGGVLLATLPARGDPSVLDLAPTVLGFFGIKPPPTYTGRNLW
jgi:predicted AlkP superfamily phosphohydrolase/phosphomutase